MKIWIRNAFPLNPLAKIKIEDLIPNHAQTFILKTISSKKEGGILVEFSQIVNLDEINNHLSLENGVAARILQKKALQVHGDPWIDDIIQEKVSRRLKINSELQKEILFKEFRKYGELLNIIKEKDHVLVDYKRTRDAIDAKICTELSGVSYDKFKQELVVWSWINSHFRMILPVALGLIGLISLLVFDPIRIFSIEREIKDEGLGKKLGVKLRKFRGLTSDKSKEATKKNIEQKTVLEALELNLEARPENIILVNGPSGSGKSELVKEAIRDRKFLLIDCKAILTEHYSRQLANLASQINYFPDFSGFNFLGKMVDSLIGILTGSKITPVDQIANLSASEKEYRQMMDCLTLALSNIVKKQKSRKHVTDLEIDYPVIVIDGYLNNIGNNTSNSSNNIIFKVLEEWAAFVIEQKIAHIVFISDVPLANKSLLQGKFLNNNAKVLESRPLDLYTLSDSNRESAIAFIKEDLGDSLTQEEYEKCIDVVGGRLTDLQQLVTKLKTGRSLLECLQDIRGRAINEMAKVGLSSKDRQWSSIQFWKIVQLLSKYDQVDFDNLRYHQLFNGDSSSILAMERSGIISITRDQGKEINIRSGRPILRSAFQEMSKDPKLVATLGVDTTKSLIESESKKLIILEQELEQLSKSFKSISSGSWLFSWKDEISSSLKTRIQVLSKEIKTCTLKLVSLNNQLLEYKKSLVVLE